MLLPADLDERQRRAIKVTISVAAAALLLWLLLRAVDWNEAWGILKRLSPATWLAVFAVHAGIYCLRTLRFAALSPDRRVPFAHLWSIQAANQMASLLLPMRTGEITYPIYLRGAGVPLEVGVAGLVVSRALDLLAVLMITVFSAIYVGTPLEKLRPGMAIPVVLLVALVAAALLAVATGGARFIRFLNGIAVRLGASFRLVGRVEQVARGFETVGRYRAVAEAFTLTLLIWIGVDVFYYLLMLDLGFAGIRPVDVAFGASAAILTNLLPVNTFAGIGTQEIGWTWGFELLGVGYTAAAASAVAVHAVQLVNVALLGVIAQFNLRPPLRTEAERALRFVAAKRRRLLDEVATIDEREAAARPAGGGWTIAEIVDHLARVEQSIVDKMRALLEQPGDVKAGRRVRLPLPLVSIRVWPLRLQAPARVKPKEGVVLSEAVAGLEASRRGLEECLRAADDQVLRGKRFRHKLLGALDLIEWARFIGYHEVRHLRQIRAARRAPR